MIWGRKWFFVISLVRKFIFFWWFYSFFDIVAGMVVINQFFLVVAVGVYVYIIYRLYQKVEVCDFVENLEIVIC